MSSSARKGAQRIIQSEEPLLDQVKNFELQANDEKTVRHLANLVEKAENTEPEDFDWNELFYELDNKIDFCKANLPSEFNAQLEKLDEINANNYQYVKSKHLAYVDSVIVHFENIGVDLAKKKPSTALALTFVGLRPSYMGEQFIYTLINILYVFLLGTIGYNGWLSYKYPALFNGNLPKATPADISLIQSMGQVLLGISIGFYLLFVLLGLRKILKYKKEIQKNIDSRIKFETYKAELVK